MNVAVASMVVVVVAAMVSVVGAVVPEGVKQRNPS